MSRAFRGFDNDLRTRIVILAKAKFSGKCLYQNQVIGRISRFFNNAEIHLGDELINEIAQLFECYATRM